MASNNKASDDAVAAVAAANQKLGSFPVVTLADGSKVPTGTVATLAHNIKLYDNLYEKQSRSEDEDKQMTELEEQIKATIPILHKSGLLEIITPEEWALGGLEGKKKSRGRMLVGEWAMK